MLWGGLLLLLFGLVVSTSAQTGRTAPVLQIEGAIGPATSDYIAQGLDRAVEDNAPLVIVRMDTPGGLDTSMREIIREILSSPIPVVTYVAPSGARAASAGAYILYASHVAAMSPGTNVGAATPVQIGGGSPFSAPDKEREKVEKGADKAEEPKSASEAKALNDAIAYIRSLAELRGRNVEWAEAAVRDAESLSADAALDQRVIDLVARDLRDLLTKLDGRTVRLGGIEQSLDTNGLALRHVEPNWRTRLLAVITNPNVALILMMIGVYGLIFEFMNPGALYPGTIGAICLLVGLYSLAALPVNYAGLALVVLGIALMVGEAFAPSFGILGIGGVVALVLGGTILIDSDLPQFRIDWPVLAAIAVVALGLAVAIGRLAVTSRRRKVVSGGEELIGAKGVVLDWEGGRGYVFVHSERWRAASDDALLPEEPVRVIAREGLILRVEAERPEEPPIPRAAQTMEE